MRGSGTFANGSRLPAVIQAAARGARRALASGSRPPRLGGDCHPRRGRSSGRWPRIRPRQEHSLGASTRRGTELLRAIHRLGVRVGARSSGAHVGEHGCPRERNVGAASGKAASMNAAPLLGTYHRSLAVMEALGVGDARQRDVRQWLPPPRSHPGWSQDRSQFHPCEAREHGLVRFEIDQTTCARDRRMIRRRVWQHQPETLAQRKGIAGTRPRSRRTATCTTRRSCAASPGRTKSDNAGVGTTKKCRRPRSSVAIACRDTPSQIKQLS